MPGCLVTCLVSRDMTSLLCPKQNTYALLIADLANLVFCFWPGIFGCGPAKHQMFYQKAKVLKEKSGARH